MRNKVFESVPSTLPSRTFQEQGELYGILGCDTKYGYEMLLAETEDNKGRPVYFVIGETNMDYLPIPVDTKPQHVVEYEMINSEGDVEEVVRTCNGDEVIEGTSNYSIMDSEGVLMTCNLITIYKEFRMCLSGNRWLTKNTEGLHQKKGQGRC